MDDNMNQYTGGPTNPYAGEPANPYGAEPVNPYDQQPSYAQDMPDADPYTQDSFNTDNLDVGFDPTPVQQPTQPFDPNSMPQTSYSQKQSGVSSTPVAPIPGQGYGQSPVQPSNPYNQGSSPYGSFNPTPTYNSFEEPEDGKATAGLVCSIISILCCGIIVAPIGIVLSCVAIKAGNKSTKASAGLVVGIISLILNIIVAVFAIIAWYRLIEAAM